MTDRRSGPPLFDLMRERGQDPNAPQPVRKPSDQPAKQPGTQPNTQPSPAPRSNPQHVQDQPRDGTGPVVATKQTAWDSSGGVSRAERSAAAAMFDEPSTNDSGLRVPMSRVYLIAVVVLALLIGAWVVGYKFGLKDGKSQIEQYVRDQPVVPRSTENEPVTSPVEQNNPSTNPITSTGSEQETRPNTPSPSTSGATLMSSNGFLSTDPRQAGLNYLVLATLSTEQAADAIAFMGQHGVDIIGVPVVDSGASRANNPSRYTLYSLGLAIPGNRWSAMSVERNQHQTLIANLGVRWQRERRGGSDFTQTNWEKFEP